MCLPTLGSLARRLDGPLGCSVARLAVDRRGHTDAPRQATPVYSAGTARCGIVLEASPEAEETGWWERHPNDRTHPITGPQGHQAAVGARLEQRPKEATP